MNEADDNYIQMHQKRDHYQLKATRAEQIRPKSWCSLSPTMTNRLRHRIISIDQSYAYMSIFKKKFKIQFKIHEVKS